MNKDQLKKLEANLWSAADKLRTIHSFDPCIACAVHLTDPDGKELMQVKVL